MSILPEPFPANGLPLVGADDESVRTKARAPLLLTQADVRTCTRVVEVGIFFDGTNNNMKRDLPQKGHTNVARLLQAYPDRPDLYKYAHYIPGVGTQCNEVGEPNPEAFKVTMLGLAMAGGGWGRILLGCVHLLNAIHRALTEGKFLLQSDAAISARINSHVPNFWDTGSLRLVIQAQFKDELLKLAQLVKNQPKPTVRLVSLSVFGFSRGAAQARAFVNVVQFLCDAPGKQTIAGMPVEVKFVGLFDTVASVGPLLNALNSNASIYLGVDGRFLWANPAMLALPPGTNAVHFVAAHEQRRSFPLDILVGASVEHVYLGVHSDVGGGYNPREEGRSLDSNARDMLARIACMNMHRLARRAGVPLYALDQMPTDDAREDFAPIPPLLVQTFNNYRVLRGAGAADVYAELRAQAGHYLRWRGGKLVKYEATRFYANASRQEQQDLWDANQELLRDLAVPSSTNPTYEWTRAEVRAGLSSSEQAACEALFAGYMHDSMAGFMVLGSTRAEMAKLQKQAHAAYVKALEDFKKVPALRASTHRYVGRTLREPAIAPLPPENLPEGEYNTSLKRREPLSGYLQYRRVFPLLNSELAADAAQESRLRSNKANEEYQVRLQKERERKWHLEAEAFERTRSR